MSKYILSILLIFVIIPTYANPVSLPGGPELVADGGALSTEPMNLIDIESDNSNENQILDTRE